MTKQTKANDLAQELLGQLSGIHSLVELLEENKRQIDSFFSLSPDIFMIVEEKTGTIVRVNPRFEEVLGWTVASVVGQPFSDYVIPEDAKRSIERLQRIVRENRGDESSFTNSYLTRDGGSVRLDWRSAPPKTGFVYAVARPV